MVSVTIVQTQTVTVNLTPVYLASLGVSVSGEQQPAALMPSFVMPTPSVTSAKHPPGVYVNLVSMAMESHVWNQILVLRLCEVAAV